MIKKIVVLIVPAIVSLLLLFMSASRAATLEIAKILKKATLHSENIYLAEYENRTYTIQVDKLKRLHSIAYYDDLDNKVQILFKNMKYGKGDLPVQSMKCNYPIEYDMIRG